MKIYRRVVDHWNNLPRDVASATSLFSFKAKMDEYFTFRGLVFTYSWD